MSNMTEYTEYVNMEGLLWQAFHACSERVETLRTEYLRLPEEEYFLDVIKRYYEPAEKKPKIIIFGTDYPDEIVHAITGKPPYHIIGGSRILAEASDEYVPRDTDPVTRAALGQLFAMEYMRESALVIVPCASDAQRKAAYLLQSRGWNVVSVWMPSAHDEAAHNVYLSEVDHSVRVICRHVRRRYSTSALKRSVKYYEEIRGSIRAFMEAAKRMSGPLRMAIMGSLYMTSDLDEWRVKLDKLTAALPKNELELKGNPRILLVGSPVYMPNYKIPFLLYNSGLEICSNVDSSIALFEGKISDKATLETLAAHYFDHNASAAFVNNTVLHNTILDQVKRTRPDGIVWHVLKGQIEYDFELVQNEVYFEEQNLPVIRLETDYQDQDVEQLRIRIEAFAELLTQRKMEKGDWHE